MIDTISLEMFATAFLLGLLGSVHCVGMCGPIAMALPVRQHNFAGQVLRYALYHTGKISTYVLLGVLIGSVGSGFLLMGFQQWLSIALGVLMIAYVILPGSYLNRFSPAFLSRFISHVKAKFGYFITQKSLLAFVAIGFLNGFLPCGLVYVALAGALATFGVLSGGVFMFFFGLGTIPLLSAFVIYANATGFKTMKLFQRVIPIVMLLMGVLLILRGLNLGIPYLSPAIGVAESVSGECK